MKRFYKKAAATPDGNGRWGVALDGRPVRTPSGAALAVPTEALGNAVAGEWDAQGDKIDPLSMPLVKFANTAIDRVTPQRDYVIEEIARFAASDLVCYRAAHPQPLVDRQCETWQPLVGWAADTIGARLHVIEGVTFIEQDAAALAAVRAAVAAHDDYALAALHALTTASGSVVIGLAVAHGRLDPDAAVAAAQLDELYQAELWGVDREADHRRKAAAAEMAAAIGFLKLLRQH